MTSRQFDWMVIAQAFGTPIHERNEAQLRLTSRCLIRAWYLLTGELAEPVIDFQKLMDCGDSVTGSGWWIEGEYWVLPGREDLREGSELLNEYDQIRTDIAIFLATISDQDYKDLVKDTEVVDETK